MNLREDFEIAEHRHQQIVEVVGDPAGQLTEALDLPHLVHLREGGFAFAGAILDPPLQVGVGLGQFGGALGDAPFEFGVQRLELPRLAVQLGEDPHLGAQHLRHDRHRHVIDRARLDSRAAGRGR